jgi:hypothetical protein
MMELDRQIGHGLELVDDRFQALDLLALSGSCLDGDLLIEKLRASWPCGRSRSSAAQRRLRSSMGRMCDTALKAVCCARLQPCGSSLAFSSCREELSRWLRHWRSW